MPPRHTSTIGQRIRAARRAVGLSQAKLGQAAGIADFKNASVRMTRYENHKTIPDMATLRAIAAALNLPLGFLVTEDDTLALLILALHNMSPDERKLIAKTWKVTMASELDAAVEQALDKAKKTKNGPV